MAYDNIMDKGALWWDAIAGPSSLIADIQCALAVGHSVICNVTTALSYRWFFRDSIDHWLADRDVEVRYIDCDGEYHGGDITEFLLSQIHPNMLTNYQRRRSPQFLRENKLLDGKLLWIQGVPSEFLRDWIQYISSYRGESLENGLLLMEMQQDLPVRLPENLSFFDYRKYVHRDDLRLYASILVESYLQNEPSVVKQYAVELVSSLCVTDAELVNDLLSCPEFISEDPIKVLRRVADDNYVDSPRGNEEDHPFRLLSEGNLDQLDNRIWSAQLRIGYPRIEMERQFIISRWEAEIQEALDLQYYDEHRQCAEYFTDYEKNRITNPYDVEVGMIYRMMILRRYVDRERYMFYLPNSEDRERVRLLRDCRNNLAHLGRCDEEQFYRLLSKE